MPLIRVIGDILDLLGPHPTSMLAAFVGRTMEADGPATLALRQEHGRLMSFPGTFEVALEDALATLIEHGQDLSAQYWGDTVRPYLIYVPHANAEIVTDATQ